MRTKLNRACQTVIVGALAILASVNSISAQNTAFTYNGRLTGNGTLVTGLYDMQFTLYDAINGNGVSAGPLDPIPVGVTNGLFTVRIDFGAGKFTGPPRWLEVAVRPSGSVTFTNLSPRQEVTSSPYSIRSQSAGSADSGGGGIDSVWSVTATSAYYTNGNVGIGTAVPATALEVDGIVRSARSGNGSQYLQLDGAFNAGDPLSIRMTAQSIAGAEKNLVIRNLTGEATPGANNAIQFAVGTAASPSTKMTINKDGNVLINPVGGSTIQFGTPAFETGMTIIGANRADVRFDGSTLKLLAGTGGGFPASGNGIAISTSGNVGIGTASPQSKLHVESLGALESTVKSLTDRASLTLDSTIGGQQRVYTLDNGLFGTPGLFGIWDRTASQARLVITTAGNVGIGTATPQTKLDVQGTTRTCVLTITGGCDLAEPFLLKEGKISKGSVVVIDDEHPGQLMRSESAYDSRVAGIVSGANGVNPGITLSQDGAFTDGENVALSGRVYVQADAAHGAIKPGDLLTTSATPGHAMKVTDHARAQGAVLGKAMSGLKTGKGMVLVLVTLQ